MSSSRSGPLSPEEITLVADQVSQLLQLDRLQGPIGAGASLTAEANIPDYIANVFEAAGAIAAPLSNEELYALVNRRVAQLQAQLYLIRLELENRDSRDPAALFEDPRVIAAYTARSAAATGTEKTFSFDPALLAHGWHPAERNGMAWYRWMRPGDMSMVYLPHLGQVDQTIEIIGQALDPAQLDGLTITSGPVEAELLPDPDRPSRFTARLSMARDQQPVASLLPISFQMQDFRQPNPEDRRLLGVNISRFVCWPDGPADSA